MRSRTCRQRPARRHGATPPTAQALYLAEHRKRHVTNRLDWWLPVGSPWRTSRALFSPALRRFLPYLRPHAPLLGVTLVAAVVALAAGTAIPLAIKSVIDGPIAHRR